MLVRLKVRVFLAATIGVCSAVGACGGRSDRADGGTANESGGSGAAAGGLGGMSGGFGGVSGGLGGMSGAGTAGAQAGAGSPGLSMTECNQVDDDYGKAFEDALACDPAGDGDQCTVKLGYGFTCGCDEFVNPANTDAVARIDASAAKYAAGSCSRFSAGTTCGACLAPLRGTCNASGKCEGVPPGSGRSCKVAGVIYADGDGGIPDPVSCNTCTCDDGVLACTAIGGCDKACPEGKTYGQACAECAPADSCALPEYDCFYPCSAGCADRNLLCVDDMCVSTACR